MKVLKVNDKLRETLVITQEECAEVIQVISKIFRFGLDENDHRLEDEIGDVLCMIDLLIVQGVINPHKLELAKRLKAEKLKKWSSIYD
jgi:NTP pyrophosphatase (non-canonical NTP hydrolase)